MSTDSPETAPGPSGLPLLGSLLDVRRDFTGFLQRVAAQYGDVAQYRIASKRSFLLSHPDHIAQVLQSDSTKYSKGWQRQYLSSAFGAGLFTSDGEDWARKRKALQPAFLRSHVGTWFDIVSDATEAMVQSWRTRLARTDRLDLSEEMMRLTQTVIVRVLFGRAVDNVAEDRMVRDVNIVNGFLMRYLMRETVLGGVLNRLPLPSTRRYLEAISRMHSFIDQQGKVQDTDEDAVVTRLSRECSSATELRDELMTLLLAGLETTAQALTWTFYYLSRSAEARDAVREEVASVVDGRLTLADLAELRYTRAAVEESMRLCPPAFALARRIEQDDVIGGRRLERGALAVLSQYVMHRDSRYWDDSARFNPDRFLGDRKPRSRFAYFPFGGGARSCIGVHLAMMEMVTVVATLTKHFHITPGDRRAVVPECLITLRPRGGLLLKVRAAEQTIPASV